MQPSVDLTIRYGSYGEQSKTVVVPISKMLMNKLMERVELSNEPFSLVLASPGMFGGYGNAVTIRRKTFAMRREIAEQIAKAMVPALLQAFGVNDELDGYRISDMTPEEREWHARRGRLPKEKS